MRNASRKERDALGELALVAAPRAAAQSRDEQNAGFRRCRSSYARSIHVFIPRLPLKYIAAAREIQDANQSLAHLRGCGVNPLLQTVQ